MRQDPTPSSKQGLWRALKRTWPSWWGILPVSSAILLGAVGLMQYCGEGLLRSLYETWNIFALNGLSCAAARDPINPYFVAAELLAAFVLFLAVVRLLFKPLWIRLKLSAQALFHPDSRFILIGYGALNQEIARELAQKRVPMTIVSRSFDGAAVDFAASHRAVLLERDVKQEGGTASLWLNRCKHVIVACGDDSLTLEVARRIGSEYHDIPSSRKRHDASAKPIQATKLVQAHFSSLEMHRQVLRSRDLGLGFERRFSGFSIREETAQHLVARAWLAERAWIAGQDRVHVVVAGVGDVGLAIVREVLQHGLSAKLKHPPLVSVLDCDGVGAKARLKASMPRIFDNTLPVERRPKVQFFEGSVEALRFEDPEDCDASVLACLGASPLELDDGLLNPSPVTAWVISCKDDTQNLTTAMRLESAMRRGVIAPAVIYPRQWQSNITSGNYKDLGQNDPLHLFAPFGGMDNVVETLTFMNDDLERIARSVHSAYLGTRAFSFEGSPLSEAITKFGKPPWTGSEAPENRLVLEAQYAADLRRTNLDWDDLGDEGRLQNYDPARLAALRLWELGFDWKGRHAGGLPSLEARHLERLQSQDPTEHLDPKTDFGAIARAEHDRWMTERALRGWTKAQTVGDRSDSMRLHPNFDLYENLGDRAQRTNKSIESFEAQNRDLRLLDIATVQGTVRGLVQTTSGETGWARPNLGHWINDPARTFDLVGDKALPKEATAVTLRIPDSPSIDPKAPPEDTERILRPFLQSIETGRDHMLNWVRSGAAGSIRLRPQGPNTLEAKNTEVRDALIAIIEASKGNGVQVWLDYPDVRAARRIARKDVSET